MTTAIAERRAFKIYNLHKFRLSRKEQHSELAAVAVVAKVLKWSRGSEAVFFAAKKTSKKSNILSLFKRRRRGRAPARAHLKIYLLP